MAHSNWGTTPIHTRNHEAIAKRELSVEKWNQVGNPGEGHGLFQESTIDSTDPRASIWLYSSDEWNKSFPEGWEAVQVLGSGGYGIAGHWRYTREGPHQRGAVEGQVRDIVVKQAGSVYNKGLIMEAHVMELLTKTGSRHFPQIYGRVHRDVGRQDGVTVDHKRREVHRIFMEYFEEGSVGSYLKYQSHYDDGTSEDKLWAWFHCFAKAVVAMERGHELEEESRFSHKEPWVRGREIVHFDLKPDNALMTAVRDEKEHMNVERVVVSDLGIAMILPNERNGPHRDRAQILHDNEDVGTLTFRTPEQNRFIVGPTRRYGACSNIYQVGCIMYCLIMRQENFSMYDPATYTPLTGNKMHQTIGGKDLEAVDDLSKTLRGLVAECLFVDPAYRPTTIELLKRTRDRLQRLNPWAGTASRTYQKLRSVKTLLLDQWFGKDPGNVWPLRIPEMQEVVSLRHQQRYQIKHAKEFAAKRRTGQNTPGTDTQEPGPPGGPATGQNPPGTNTQGPDPPGGPATGQNPPADDTQPGAPPGTAPNETDAAQPPLPKTDTIPLHKPWPGQKFLKPSDILKDTHPRKVKLQTAGDILLAKQPDWDRVVKDVRRPNGGRVPRPQKRASPEPPAAEPDPKRLQQVPARIRQVDMMNRWLHAVDLNRVEPAHQPPLREQQKFLIPVRIWPGPTPSPADEAVVKLCTYQIPINATLRDLLKVMTDDDGSGIKRAVRCTFGKPGRGDELSLSTPVADLGYGPAPRVRMAHLELFRTMFAPVRYGPGGVARSFTVIVFITPRPVLDRRAGHLTIKAGLQMTILQLKKVVIDSDFRSDFRHTSQLRIHYGGDDMQAQDCPDHRLIKSFFKNDSDDVPAKMWCSLRSVGEGGSGARRPLRVDPVYTPPRYRFQRVQRRFL